jgi:hypothetical protein
MGDGGAQRAAGWKFEEIVGGEGRGFPEAQWPRIAQGRSWSEVVVGRGRADKPLPREYQRTSAERASVESAREVMATSGTRNRRE